MPRLLWLTIVVLTAGIVLRLQPSLAGLFAGTAVIGAAVAVANVLLPGLIKRDFPGQVGLMMGLYSMSLFVGAALSAGLTVPLEHAAGIGWRPAMALWAVPAAVAVVVWALRPALPGRPVPHRRSLPSEDSGAIGWPGWSPASWASNLLATTPP